MLTAFIWLDHTKWRTWSPSNSFIYLSALNTIKSEIATSSSQVSGHRFKTNLVEMYWETEHFFMSEYPWRIVENWKIPDGKYKVLETWRNKHAEAQTKHRVGSQHDNLFETQVIDCRYWNINTKVIKTVRKESSRLKSSTYVSNHF